MIINSSSFAEDLPGEQEPGWEENLSEVEALRRRCELLEAVCEQLRHGMGQLARENHNHHQRQIIASQRRGWRRRAKLLAMALWRRLGRGTSCRRGGYEHEPCPRVCFLGDGVSGSWLMRGQQIASTRPQWLAKSKTSTTWRILPPGCEIFCFVKRFDARLASWLRSNGKLVVYDVVDPWKQPDDGITHASLPEVVGYFREKFAQCSVDGVIFPTQAMHQDLGPYVPAPVTIYHHHRIGLPPICVRPQPRVVAYEGNLEFLGPWQDMVPRVCARLGLKFVVNPPSLSDADIGFAARGGRHASLMAQRYKSNVKLANFYAAGLPCVVHHDEVSYRETDNGHVRFFGSAEELEAQLRALLPYEVRREIHLAFLKESRRYRLETIADCYESYFRQLLMQRAVPA